MEFQAVLDAVRSLPVADQFRLLDQVREDLTDHYVEDELDTNEDSDLTPELKAELDRRLADLKANPDSGIPLEQVLAEARARYKR